MSEDEALQTRAALAALDAAMHGRRRSRRVLRRPRRARTVTAAAPAPQPHGESTNEWLAAAPVRRTASAARSTGVPPRFHARSMPIRSTLSSPPPGHALLVFTEDPVRYKETLDLAVIAPEVARAFAGRFRVGVLYPDAARKVARALALRAGQHWCMLRMAPTSAPSTGCATGTNTSRDAAAAGRGPTRPPSVGIAVNSAGGDSVRLWSLNICLQARL